MQLMGDLNFRPHGGGNETHFELALTKTISWSKKKKKRRGLKEMNLPNQQRTLNKLPTELRCGHFVDKHRLSMQIRHQTC